MFFPAHLEAMRKVADAFGLAGLHIRRMVIDIDARSAVIVYVQLFASEDAINASLPAFAQLVQSIEISDIPLEVRIEKA